MEESRDPDSFGIAGMPPPLRRLRRLNDFHAVRTLIQLVKSGEHVVGVISIDANRCCRLDRRGGRRRRRRRRLRPFIDLSRSRFRRLNGLRGWTRWGSGRIT
jgi:hypothetical protein